MPRSFKRLNNLKLGAKFNLLLLLAFLGAVILSGVTLSNALNQRGVNEVTTQAKILLQTISAVRTYTDTQITPLLASTLKTSTDFVPQSVAAYSAAQVFSTVRENQDAQRFLYKEATLNPTNPRDQADEFETQIVQHFRQNQDIKELSGYRDLAFGKVFYIARPIAVTSNSCLQCHSTPSAAPRAQIATYGQKGGFGWHLNEIVGSQILSVPADTVFASSRTFFFMVMTILTGIFTAVLLGTNWLLSKAVIQPLKQMSQLAKEVSTGRTNADFEQTSKDEIGTLAASFNRMKSSLEIALGMLQDKP